MQTALAQTIPASSDLTQFLANHPWAGNILSTAVLLVVVLAMRWAPARALRKAQIASIDLRRRWLVQIRNICFLIFLLGMIVIWASQLRPVAISLVAVLVVMVIATKELILCFSGSIMKVTTKAFAIGNRIEIDGVRGEGVDQTLLSTTWMEIGPGQATHPFTGRSVVFPNALLLAKPVFNENLDHAYVFHVMSFPLKATEPCLALAERLNQIAQGACKDYLENARKRISRLNQRYGLNTPTIDPRVSLEFPDADNLTWLGRLAVPAHRKDPTERDIRYKFLEARQATPDKNPLSTKE